MDTKSRKLVQNRFLKFLAFALAVICTTALCMMTFSAGNGEIFTGPVFEAQYEDSGYFASEMYARARDVNQLITFYKSEENIRAGRHHQPAAAGGATAEPPRGRPGGFRYAGV